MPAYADFDTAYTATRNDLFDMSVKTNVGWTNYNEIQAYIDTSDWANALQKVKAVLWVLLTNFDTFIDDTHGAIQENAFNDCSYWNDQAISGTEVTWKAIVEAWIKDDFAGRAPTIAVIDRMRQILWNEPFKATWAARPETGI